MPLIKCRECGNDISDLALSCPKCGAPIVAIPRKRSWSLMWKIIKWLVFIFIIGYAIPIMMSNFTPKLEDNPCNSDSIKEQAIEISKNTPQGKILGIHIVAFRSVDAPQTHDGKMTCKADALMSNNTNRDYEITTEIVGGKLIIGIVPGGGAVKPVAAQTIAPLPPTIPVAEKLPVPDPMPNSVPEPAPATLTPYWCPKAGTPVEKLICSTPELSALAQQFEEKWADYKLTHRPDEIAAKKALLKGWNREVLQKCSGVKAVSDAYTDALTSLF